MEKVELKKDDKIFYGGDMANNQAFGKITDAYSNRWGSFVDIEYDNGSISKGISVVMFSATYSGNGSTRFVKIEAYHEYRKKQLTLLKERFGK